MIASAEGFGAPESVPAGNVAANASTAVRPSDSRPVTSDTRCMIAL